MRNDVRVKGLSLDFRRYDLFLNESFYKPEVLSLDGNRDIQGKIENESSRCCQEMKPRFYSH